MALLLKTTKQIETQLDQFLDTVSDAAMLFQLGMEDYLLMRVCNVSIRTMEIVRAMEKGNKSQEE